MRIVLPKIFLLVTVLLYFGLFPQSIMAHDISIRLPFSDTSRGIPHLSRMYLNNNFDDFIMIPTSITSTITHNKSQPSISQTENIIVSLFDTFHSIYVSIPDYFQDTIQMHQSDTVVIMSNPPSPVHDSSITIWTILNWLKSPMITGFIIIFALAYMLHSSFSNMSREELREFSGLAKNFTNFKVPRG